MQLNVLIIIAWEDFPYKIQAYTYIKHFINAFKAEKYSLERSFENIKSQNI